MLADDDQEPFDSEGPLTDGSPRSASLAAACPSIIDLPKPGCWHLTLDGLGWADTIDLVDNED